MTNESRAQSGREPVHAVCAEMGEAAVLADLERAGVKFQSSEQKRLAWEWAYEQRINRERATEEALRVTARQTLRVAIGTFLVALFTALLVLAELLARHG